MRRGYCFRNPAALIRGRDGGNGRRMGKVGDTDRAGARRDQIRPRRAGAGDRPATRHRRNPDGRVDEPRGGAYDPGGRPGLLLVALPRHIVAQRRNLGAGAAVARDASRLRRRHGAAARRPAPASPATPGGATAFSAPGAGMAGRSLPSRRSTPSSFIRRPPRTYCSGGQTRCAWICGHHVRS